jgi:hypothetical protein
VYFADLTGGFQAALHRLWSVFEIKKPRPVTSVAW